MYTLKMNSEKMKSVNYAPARQLKQEWMYCVSNSEMILILLSTCVRIDETDCLPHLEQCYTKKKIPALVGSEKATLWRKFNQPLYH